MKVSLIIFCLVSVLGISCSHSQDCIEGINKLPMYGNVKKCPEQIQDDKTFIAACEQSSTRKDAAAHMIMRGWEYLYKQQLDTAMMRFNQAWLLDSLNANVYWGFGNILGMQQKFVESVPFFERSLKLDATNAKVWGDASTSYGNAFFQTKNQKYLNSAISALKHAVQLAPTNAQYYSQLTASYCYFMQKDSAKKYMKITDKLDPNAIRPEVRKMLAGK